MHGAVRNQCTSSILALRISSPPPPTPSFQVRITAIDTALLSSRGHRQFQSVRAVAEVGMRLRGLAQRIGMALAFDSLEVSHDDFSVLSRVSGSITGC